MIERSLDEVVEAVQNAHANNRACSLLVGAGCSVKAGVPTAQGFVDEIKKRHPYAFNRAKNKTYAQCMAELTVGQRRDLITEFVGAAKINWAHVCIALLMREGYVDRVLTTNFDQLVAKAASILCDFPAVYDFGASQRFNARDVPRNAVFNLHGQYTGFVLLNTDEEIEKHSETLAPVFQDAGIGRLWIVVGYSGENDPVFNHLADVDRFDDGLYWVGYKDNAPAAHVREKLLVEGKDAFSPVGLTPTDSLSS